MKNTPDNVLTSGPEALVDVTAGAWLLLEPGTWENHPVIETTDAYTLIKVKGNVWGMVTKTAPFWALRLAGEYKIENAVHKYGGPPCGP